MKEIRKEYTDFHLNKKSHHNYPTEWVIRTMLGDYPELKLDRSNYNGGKVLDLGFGDPRNISLLHNCGLEIYGVEVTEETVSLGYETLAEKGIKADLRVGCNSNIPFADSFFDYILASASCYYVDEGETFKQNLEEIYRVLKKSGYLIANFPAFSPSKDIEESFILQGCIPTEDGHIIIQNDIYGLRNGYRFKAFANKEEIVQTFQDKFDQISIGQTFDNYYGVQINAFLLTARKK
jgi:ubiquinone/menaquinone biosynthesis C-methylase UbiE